MRFLYLIACIAFFFSSCGSHADHHEEESDHHDDHGIHLSEEKIREFGILHEKVERSDFRNVIKTTGVVEPAPSDIKTLVAKKAGIVTLSPTVNVDASVKTGQNLATISVDGIQGGDVTAAAVINLESARSEYERLLSLYDAGLVTTSVIREVERAYKEAEALVGRDKKGGSSSITSPFDGSVRELFVKSGDFVEVGSPVLTVSKNTTLSLRADVPSRHTGSIPEITTANIVTSNGDKTIMLSEMEGKRVSGNVSSSQNGYSPVYFTFSGNPLNFGGGYVEVYLLGKERPGVISVPKEALIEIQGEKYLYVRLPDGDYDKRLVTTGASDGQRVEILSGIKEGDTIVSKGASVVRMAEVSSIAPPSHTHNH